MKEEEKQSNTNTNNVIMNKLMMTSDSFSDLDLSFTSTASTSTSTTSASSSSARSSLSLTSRPSFSPSTSSSSAMISPHPHSRHSPHWSALRTASSLSPDGSLHLRHLHLLRPLGSGHLSHVFHCRLKSSPLPSDFALKVVDLNTAAAAGDADKHVLTESRVLSALDHPFLPTLYARLDASHYSCFLIDFCPGGDLHSLLLRHPRHRLPPPVVRFLAAEVLLALEYLHSLGFVYRDLKPENVLIRSDGHVMLSDFDLCFSSEVKPALYRRRQQQDGGGGELEFVAEPEAAFSRACVGTHEYLAPEMVAGRGHGSGVDWWAFGVFVYELLYGRTPYKGPTKEATLKNILKRSSAAVRFPRDGGGEDDVDDEVEAAARDLIRRLLVAEAGERLGSRRGAAEIKKHPFFKGVKWPLIRNSKSPLEVGPAGAVVAMEEKGGGWWSRVVGGNYSKYLRGWVKRGVKFGSSHFYCSISSSSSSNNGNKRRGKKEKSRK